MSVEKREAEFFGFHEKTDLDEVKKSPISSSDTLVALTPPKKVDYIAATNYQYVEHGIGVNILSTQASSFYEEKSQPAQQSPSGTTMGPVFEKHSDVMDTNVNTQSLPDISPENQESVILTDRSLNVHARRRMGVIGAGLALGLALFSGNIGVTLPTILSGSNSMAATPPVPDQGDIEAAKTALQNALNTAQGYYKSNGTYKGLTLTSGVSTVTGKNMVVIAAVINGACWYSAILPSYDPTPRWDATASRCNPERLKQLQAEINANE